MLSQDIAMTHLFDILLHPLIKIPSALRGKSKNWRSKYKFEIMHLYI